MAGPARRAPSGLGNGAGSRPDRAGLDARPRWAALRVSAAFGLDRIIVIAWSPAEPAHSSSDAAR